MNQDIFTALLVIGGLGLLYLCQTRGYDRTWAWARLTAWAEANKQASMVRARLQRELREKAMAEIGWEPPVQPGEGVEA